MPLVLKHAVLYVEIFTPWCDTGHLPWLSWLCWCGPVASFARLVTGRGHYITTCTNQESLELILLTSAN